MNTVDNSKNQDSSKGNQTGSSMEFVSAPSVSLPKGGGAIRGIGEKFAANPVTGTASLRVPIFTTPGRSGFGPQLSLSYDSGAGNGPFGFGWNLSVPCISRKTDKGLPRYRDEGNEEEVDVFILSDAEDLVPVLRADGTRDTFLRTWHDTTYKIQRFRPRIEGSFARIECWQDNVTGLSHWRSITKDNITNIYGDTPESRIADPDDRKRVFTWLLTRSYDARGNLVVYQYKAENNDNVPPALHESNRKVTANRYLKGIFYGGQTPYYPLGHPELPGDWHFQVVFDYGEHDANTPGVEEESAWPVRPDPFSSYRAGFEIRTYRRCRRVLMFHKFPGLGDEPCLVRSTDFTYEEQDEPHPVKSLVASFIISIEPRGYIRKGGIYESESFPPLEIRYSEVKIDEMICTADASSLENLPGGPGGGQYKWTDLESAGLPGVLTEQAGAWFFKANAPAYDEEKDVPGAGFLPLERVGSKPSLARLNAGQQQLMDLGDQGELCLVDFSAPMPGFYEYQRSPIKQWKPFKPFRFSPNIPWGNPNLRTVDLNGDGHADILISEDEVFTWYPSRGREGFGPSAAVRQATDEDKGPRLVFADGTESIYLADMSGDGLIDLVRIRNGEVCYWPNLGYGRFGARITMSDAPLLDQPTLFDQKRIRLADIDGSGNTDIIYLGRDTVKLYFNRSGNSWSSATDLKQFPLVDNLASVQVVDLLGNGTSCLVWSSPLPGDAHQPMKYIDLMGGKKPHLLTEVNNNMGAVTRVKYAPSTKFYLEDRANGQPWITKLHFPVSLVEQVEVYDHANKTKLVSKYKYHHGYFDGAEREFRGFGKVEQWDTEVSGSAGEEFHLPPVRTVTWFHNGAFLCQGNISRHFETEYYQGDAEACLLPDTILPPGLSPEEAQEACRALKGKILRQEVYAEDDTGQSQHPYSVTEHAYRLRMLQSQQDNRHAVFYSYESEVLSYHYERQPHDPRISHQLTLAVDKYGNVTRAAAVAYPRRPGPGCQPEQSKTFITYTENQITNKPDETHWYCIGVPVETRTYEVTGLLPMDTIFTIEEFSHGVGEASEISYEEKPGTGSIRKRLIEHIRAFYRKNDLSAPLPLGEVESMALPYQNYKLAFTPGLLEQVYGTDRAAVIRGLMQNKGGYVHSEGDANWWIPSGQVFYSPEETDSPARELEFARQHFFLPHRFCDPFEKTSYARYDDFHFMVEETSDPLDNRVTVTNHYRTMQPQIITDANGNRSAVRFDAVGMVVQTFAMGKVGSDQGDRFDETSQELSPLDDPTTKLDYNLHNWKDNEQPVYVHISAREQHGPGNPRWRESYSYSDGMGREIQKKIQAEPGEAPLREEDGSLKRDEHGELVWGSTSQRWVGTGRTVFDNKGNPIKKYEPFFDSAYGFNQESQLVEWGVTPIFHYDPLGRIIRKDQPNGTFSRVAIDPWQQTTWDENDTVLESQWYERCGSPEPTDPEPLDPGTRAAWLTVKHANTPGVIHLDSLGRPFLTIEDNGPGVDGLPQQYGTHVELDIEGNQCSVTDTLGRKVMEYNYDILGTQIHRSSMEAGQRWVLNNVMGNPIRQWNSRDYTLRILYDVLQRPTHVYVRQDGGAEILVEHLVYGESHSEPHRNLRGKLYHYYDGTGVLTNERFDFKGNLVESSRQLAKKYQHTVDWSPLAGLTDLQDIKDTAAEHLEAESFVTRTRYDALNRPIMVISPHNSTMRPNVIQPVYNEANFLETVDVWLRQEDVPAELMDNSTADLHVVTNIDYNAKGQRVLIEYGNDVRSEYQYDPQTFRLSRVTTTRQGTEFSDNERIVRDLSYTYDPVGNITHIRDDADIHNVIYFRNRRVEPGANYQYDALYRLIKATGREHLGLSHGSLNPPRQTHHKDTFRMNHSHPHDGNAMGNYTRQLEYDEVGNILKMIHQADSGGWTRYYAYDETSLLDPGPRSNRLSRTSLPGDHPLGPYSASYLYDSHGNMTLMPHLTRMSWNHKDQLQSTSRQVTAEEGTPEITYYVYDASGQRVRKITDRQPAEGEMPTRKEERIYLGGFEIYREYEGDGFTCKLERESLHIMDNTSRIALVETKTLDTSGGADLDIPLTRYQYDNHLGSACLELDDEAIVISYEEYYPYGGTSLQLSNGSIRAAAKRYRYIGKERDEETGLYYHGARYYAPWLGRWISPEPRGPVDGLNLFYYSRDNPIKFFDANGLEAGNSPQSPRSVEDMLDLAIRDPQRARQVNLPFSTDITYTGMNQSETYTTTGAPIDVRGEGAPGEAYEYVRQIVTACAHELSDATGRPEVGEAFIRVMMEFAYHESGGTFAKRAISRDVPRPTGSVRIVYHPRPDIREDDPPGTSPPTEGNSSIGVFQILNVAWRQMRRDAGEPETDYPHQSSPFEEIALPIRFYYRIFRLAYKTGTSGIGTGGESPEVWAARAVLFTHITGVSEFHRFLRHSSLYRWRGFVAGMEVIAAANPDLSTADINRRLEAAGIRSGPGASSEPQLSGLVSNAITRFRGQRAARAAARDAAQRSVQNMMGPAPVTLNPLLQPNP